MDKPKKINRSNSDHAALVNRGSKGSAARNPAEKPPGALASTKSAINLSKPVTVVKSSSRSKFPVKKLFAEVPPKTTAAAAESALPSEVTPRKQFFPAMEKSRTMIEMGSPAKVKPEQGEWASTTALAGSGSGCEGGMRSSNTSKLVYETAFRMLLKCWRDKKKQISRLNAQLSHKDNTSIKYRNQLHTIQSLYQNECKNHEAARNDLRSTKKKLETLKTNLLEEKTSHLSKVSELEASVIQRDKLQEQLSKIEGDLAKAIINWHSFEYRSKEYEERCDQLESEKKELLKQIDQLEENFKNFERDYENSLQVQTNSNKVYEVRLEHHQKLLEDAKNQLELRESDCELLKEWNVRLAEELAAVKGSYHATYGYRVRQFFTNLPRKPGFYVQYALYLFVQGVPVPRSRGKRVLRHGQAVRRMIA
ncbi:uncharacterized protein LOC120419035 [Culex pipiens pallens]|uniref:uncharacterized protein LOC120419035 n=1 Tax=Culex pipiens pallens TaxID=42434 RepID=UPI0019540E68|nr:uncharacterized protein LOC120419035 [Culex pipiens pallens]